MLGIILLSSDNKVISGMCDAFSTLKKVTLDNASLFFRNIKNIKNNNIHLSRTRNDIRDADWFKIPSVPLDSEYGFKYDSNSLIFAPDSVSMCSIESESADSPFPLLKNGKRLI
ncbi:TPA: hypothetical protein ACOP2N_004727 [Salmonella enterica]|nr:hypothetical protein [Salmonella enterica]ECD3237416.1 hypothetical protein [Salmonella enterica subsp. enterica serovar Bredeney]EDR9399203.1 hypothetical protein [Salmonella enterica subsp. enterica]EDT6893262.1 hypothetical protein [Salmonella enterica subsp. enterica serovar Javiana]EDX5193543.1 hypothetical protein [Salmonella enterica subsp. enterica serovar Glostrup]EHW1129247.1 hypothetical protein [Salmonella enterica subsp. enterica serovar Kinondoni]HCM6292795.1 hypothetical pro